MAVRTDIQYVAYRVDGNTARKVERTTEENTAVPAFAHRPVKNRVIAVDPVASCGIVMAVVMLCAMCVGLLQYRACLVQSQQMSAYLQTREEENQQLSRTYRSGYDEDEIMDIALAAGMVPADSVATVCLSMEEPAQQEPQMSFWQTLTVFLAGIFA